MPEHTRPQPRPEFSYRLWLHKWMENTCDYYPTFEQAYAAAIRSGESWSIVRMSDFIPLAWSRLSPTPEQEQAFIDQYAARKDAP